MANTIFLWVHPRSTSTMFERAFLNRPEYFSVEHEPLGDAWYFGKEKVSPRYSTEKCAKDYAHLKDVTAMSIWQDIVKHTDKPRTFVKDMAQYILIPPTHADSTPALPEKDNPTLIPSKDLFAPGIIHTFLIRTPEKAVPSYYKLCTGENCAITGFDYFDPEEVGISDLRILYEFVTSKTGRKPLLIDSADLLEKPEAYMEAYCRHCQVEWDPNMLNWSSGTQEHFKRWTGFHVDAENSTGIRKPTSSTADEQKTWPKIVQDTIDANMKDYNWLKAQRLILQ